MFEVNNTMYTTFKFKRILLVAFIASSVFSSPLIADDGAKKVPLKPKLTLVGSKKKKTLGDVLKSNDVSIMQFWASWCVGCGEVMSQLAKRSKTDTSVGYVSVSIDEDMPTAVRYFRSKPEDVRAALPNALLDEGGEKIAEPLNITSLPVVLIVGRDGTVYQKIAGHPKPADLNTMIAKIRSEKGGK
ncbi:MAG: thioredoxin-like domain-containing protein [Proteobacteria bacterium]|nr:thioredoxin-like domain-containing protein [Pseudomonadota bacterium]